MVDRFFLPNGADPRRGRVTLTAEESDHAIRSRRIRAGDPVELLDGRGLVASGRVETAKRDGCVVVMDSVEMRPRAGRSVELALSVPRGPRMDDLVDAAAQLGARALQPVVFERSVAARHDCSPARIDRWRRIVREAAKQSGEAWCVEIADPVDLKSLLDVPTDGLRIALHPASDAPRLAAVLGAAPTAPVRVVIGPEGGLTDAEVALCRSRGERIVQLGDARLRIETAALAALAVARLG